MRVFRRILAGLDGSPRQPLVLSRAVALADQFGAKLDLCRAMQVPVSIPPMVWTMTGEEFAQFLLAYAEDSLTQIQRSLPEGLVSHVWTRIGQPADVICDLAREKDCDLIVIGSHGYERIDRLLGTTAAKVVNRADCSVMVVRKDPRNEA